MSRTRADAGFTLVEALVSLFVFSLIAAGSVLMLMQSVDTQRRVGEAQAALREVQTVRALLSADLAQMAPREVREADGSVRPRFIGGDADIALGLVRAWAEPDGEAGARSHLAVVEYRLVDGALVRAMRTDLDAGPATDMAERIVLRDAGAAHFEFFDGQQWRREWLMGSRGAAPPRAVALVFASPRYGPVRIETAMGLAS